MRFKDIVQTSEGIKVMIHTIKPISKFGKSRLKANWIRKVDSIYKPRNGKAVILPFSMNTERKLINWVHKNFGDGSYKINPYVKNKNNDCFDSCLGKYVIRITVIESDGLIGSIIHDDAPLKKISWYK